MPRSVLEAIQLGQWNFEPQTDVENTEATDAMPGTAQKLNVLAERLRQGQPLWNPSDRRSFNDRDED